MLEGGKQGVGIGGLGESLADFGPGHGARDLREDLHMEIFGTGSAHPEEHVVDGFGIGGVPFDAFGGMGVGQNRIPQMVQPDMGDGDAGADGGAEFLFAPEGGLKDGLFSRGIGPCGHPARQEAQDIGAGSRDGQ